MFVAMLSASVAGAIVLIYGVPGVSSFFAGTSADSRTVNLAAYVGAAIATIPAFLTSMTVGGGFGGAWAKALIGPPAIPFGAAIGMFVVLVGSVLAASAVIAAIARLIKG